VKYVSRPQRKIWRGAARGKMTKVRVRELLWYDRKETELRFPPSWSVSLFPMKGGDKRKVMPDEMEKAFLHPIGTDPLHVLAEGKKEIVILFDDMARPTPVIEIVPYVLKELEKARVSDGQVRFICALGVHGAHTAIDFRKKLGEEVLDRFPVYNHNPFDSCAYIGKTSRGTPVSINAEVMACDLKIGVGSILPHSFSGFGGGGKILFPGVAHVDSIAYNHGTLLQKHPEKTGPGRIEGNIPRLDIEEAARMAGLDFKVDAVLNLRGEITGLFVGDPVMEHRKGAELAKDVYATTPAWDMDIAVVNTYLKPSECAFAVFLGIPSLKENGGDLVILANEPAGQVVHYLFGEFGRCGGGKLLLPQPLPKKVKRMIIVSPFKDHAGAFAFGKVSSLIWVKTWREALDLLKAEWGDRANVAVYPDGSVQYFPFLLKQYVAAGYLGTKTQKGFFEY
jgi:nickel-dependent lactate racemase